MMENVENLGNRPEIEMNWVMKASEHADIHLNLISAVDPKFLKLTQMDDEIHQRFRETFPDLKVGLLDEDTLKNPAAREQWRNFCESFKTRVEDYNYGTLLRLDPKETYTQENTIIALRVQFLALEIARNREGINDFIHKTHGRK